MEEGLAYVWRRTFPLIRNRLGQLFANSSETGGVMAGMGPPPIHPVLEQSVSFLLGTWRGEGEGGFPTIQSFKYGEEIKLWHVGKPMMAYSQRTWKAASGEPMHAESGFFRPKPDGSIEAVISQSTGLAEVQKGIYDFGKKTLELRSSLVGNASKIRTGGMSIIGLSSFRTKKWSLYLPTVCHNLGMPLAFDSQVVEITRKFNVEGDELRYSVDMATQTHDLQPHLHAVLKKVPS